MPAESAITEPHGRQRMRIGAARRLTTGLALWVSALAGGCQNEPKETGAPAPGEAQLLGVGDDPLPVGRLGATADYQMSVESVEECALPPPFEAKAGHRKLAIDVTIEGTSAREVPVNLFYAMIESADGDSWEATPAGCKPVLEARRVTRGQKARGLVTFELPASARHLRLVYAPIVIGGGREELRFDLGR